VIGNQVITGFFNYLLAKFLLPSFPPFLRVEAFADSITAIRRPRRLMANLGGLSRDRGENYNSGMSSSALSASPDGNFAASLNARSSGWNAAMGIRFVHATADEVVAELTLGPQHCQPYGIVHGGVHSGLIETVASVGAALAALPRGQSVVGLENHTSFLNAVREGTLRAVARPLRRGHRPQVWEAAITDNSGRAVANGRVRFLSLEAGATLAGETVQVKSPS
jgi:1,4-dihydroxy-2-naphthoyl-CoA hydrolase